MKVPNDVLNLMEKLDSTTYNHSYRLWKLAIGLEEYFNYEDSDLSTAALLHDIGKLYVPDYILDKRGGLSTLEREVIDLHPYYGYRILYAFGVKEEIRRMVLYHHGMQPKILTVLPKFDDSLVIERATMLHTLDVFEALTTDRPYKRRMSVEQACNWMEQEQGYHTETLVYLRNYTKDFATA